MIKFSQVTKQFKQGTKALDKVSFSISKGEFIFLVGPSGAGKTTVLRLLLKELNPTEGEIKVDGEDVTKLKKKKVPSLRRKIGAVFQDFKLLFDRTVEENVGLGLEILRKNEKEIKQQTKEVLKLVGLEKKHQLFPVQLSGGEFQRTVIARALVAEPKILFADEPTGNLDLDTSWQIVNLLKKINKKGTTVIVSTHNVEIVNALETRVVRLEKGRIVSDEKKGRYKISDKDSSKKKKSRKKKKGKGK
jgi:cell division transport system ATP-binding protein